jgi:hypothetical protein
LDFNIIFSLVLNVQAGSFIIHHQLLDTLFIMLFIADTDNIQTLYSFLGILSINLILSKFKGITSQVILLIGFSLVTLSIFHHQLFTSSHHQKVLSLE